MNERILLWCSVAAAVFGIAALALIPPLPAQELVGKVVWHNTSHAWVATCEKTWVAITNGTAKKDACVTVQGYQDGFSFTGQLYLADQSVSRQCP